MKKFRLEELPWLASGGNHTFFTPPVAIYRNGLTGRKHFFEVRFRERNTSSLQGTRSPLQSILKIQKKRRKLHCWESTTRSQAYCCARGKNLLFPSRLSYSLSLAVLGSLNIHQQSACEHARFWWMFTNNLHVNMLVVDQGWVAAIHQLSDRKIFHNTEEQVNHWFQIEQF